MRPFQSARARILAAVLVLLAGSTLVSTLALRQILLTRTGERVEGSLVQEVEEFRRLVRDGRDPRSGEPFGTDVRAMFDVFLQRNVPSEGEALYTFVGQRPYRSSGEVADDPRLVDRVVRLGGAHGVARGDARGSDATVRYLAVPVVVQGRPRGTFVVTANIGREEGEVTEAVQIAAGVSLAVLVLASIIAFVIAGRVLSPLRALTETARSITESDLTRRIEAHGRDEIADLARTFNAMLDRLEGAFASQGAFVSDAGHELRTPITIIRGHLELLGDDPRERRETVDLVTDELDRMARIVDDLLTLAKSERSDFLRMEDVDLDLLSEDLVVKARALADRDWSLEAVGVGRLRADRQRLTQAVMNLAHNAAQHTSPGDPIAVGSALRGGEAHLWVRDRGPGIPPEERERIFERFARADGGRRRSDGAGLGLAIVRAIAEAHGGRVRLDTTSGAGSTFTIIVPVEPPEESAVP